MSDIHFIITGGTIDSIYHPPTETAVPAGASIIPSYVEEIIQPHSDCSFETVCLLDSGDITDDIRAQILERLANAPAQKIIICHGTNTMVETARYLNAHIKDKQQTIILCGAMIPLKQFAMSDAGFNLGYAVAQAQTAKHGVYICMHGKTFTPDTVIKNRAIARFVDA